MSDLTDRLRDDILAGRLEPGTRLVELPLAERFAVSRSAVRSSITELAKEGLVIREANRGATVRRVPTAEAIEINEVRRLLEGLIARRAAERATEADRCALGDIVSQMRSAVDENRLADYSALNGDLHRRLREIAGHDTASEVVDTLRNRSAHHAVRLAAIPGRAATSLLQHAEIVDAVIAGNGDGAERAMQAHLDSVIDVLRMWADAGVSL